MNKWPIPGEQPLRSCEPHEWNAHLGHQRWDQFAEYFYKAADSLAEATSEKKLPLESSIIPIAFLYRHYVELMLKLIIGVLRQEERVGTNYPNSTHDLRELWSEAKELILLHFREISLPSLAGMDDCIDNLHAHDPYGFSLRYPVDKTNNPNLDNLSNINLLNLCSTMGRIECFLRQVFDFIGNPSGLEQLILAKAGEDFPDNQVN